MNGHYANAAGDGEGIPAPSPHDQEAILEAWREVLGQVLHSRDNDWQKQLRTMTAESVAVVAELRANAAEICGRMEKLITERLAQIGQPANGPRGEPGPRGEQGPPGKIERLHGYVEHTVRYRGDIVTHHGSTYQAQCDTAREPPHDDWTCLATAGRDGTDGRSLRVRGTFKADESYLALDVVAREGGSFIARRNDPGECPGEGWQSLTLPGKRGERGLTGERGEKGEQGERAPAIVGWDIDRDNYTVCAVLSDQTRSTPFDLRGLFEQYLLERISVDG